MIRRFRRALAPAALALTLLSTPFASAALIIQVEPAALDAAPNSTGNVFEVNLVNDDSTTYDLVGFNATLSTPTGSGITLDSADNATTEPYIFGADGILFLFNPSTGD